MQIWVIFKSYLCKWSNFWEISSPNGLKFTLVLSYFSSFFQNIKNFKIQNKRFEIWTISKFWLFKFEKHQILHFKNHRISNRYQKVDLTTGKSTSEDAFRIVLQKISFCWNCGEKATAFGLAFTFLRKKTSIKNRTKRTLNHYDICTL
jgi:hypothetical protein